MDKVELRRLLEEFWRNEMEGQHIPRKYVPIVRSVGVSFDALAFPVAICARSSTCSLLGISPRSLRSLVELPFKSPLSFTILVLQV